MSTSLHRAVALGAALLIGSGGLAACGSDNNSSSSSGGKSSSAGAANVSAACKLSNPPTSGAKTPPSGSPAKASGKVGVILPDTTSSTRYTLYDAPLLTKAPQGRRASPRTSRTPAAAPASSPRSRRA